MTDNAQWAKLETGMVGMIASMQTSAAAHGVDRVFAATPEELGAVSLAAARKARDRDADAAGG